MHDRPAIRTRRADGSSIRGIARELGASRNAVRRAIDPEARERYWRPSLSEQYEPAVRDVLADNPRATIADVAAAVEWPGARRTLADLVARMRPAALERERDGLARPSVGSMQVGRVTLGAVKTGSDHGRQEAAREREARAETPPTRAA